jgi:hypothetical protein
MRKTLPYIVGGLALFVLGLVLGLTRSCGGLDKDYWVERAIYDRDIAAANTQHKVDVQLVASQKLIIAARDGQIAEILANAGKPTLAEVEKDGTIARLAAKVAVLEARGDLAGALSAARDEIRAWSEKFSLAERRHGADLFNLNAEWQGKFDAQVKIGDAGWAAYGREHAIRMSCDSLRIKAERAANAGGIVAKIEGTVILGVVGYFGGRALGHALKIW